MKITRNMLIGLSFAVILFGGLSVFTPSRNLMGWSWIDEYPSKIASYSFSENGCLFEITYISDWSDPTYLTENRPVSYLSSEEECRLAHEFLTRPEMALSVGARVGEDGNWEVVVDHDGELFDFQDRYKSLLGKGR